MGDIGLFGPGSQTWRVHADPLVGVGGLRALLMQALHPDSMAGVAEHSRFAEDPWGRLMRTAEYVGVTTFGSVEDALAAGARVRVVHERVRGVVPGTARPYDARSPRLLAWVHCCMVDSFLTTVRRGGLSLSPKEADTYVAEQVRAGALVGLEPNQVPHDVLGLRDYFRSVRPVLAATPAARRAAAYVLAPPMPPLASLSPARPAWASVSGLAFAALPRWARALYSLPELPVAGGLADAATTAALRILRTSLRGVQVAVPPLREGPHLREARLRIQTR